MILVGEQLKDMRIIRGKFKNKKLFFPENIKTRPLKDRVRENIFNILEHSSEINIKLKNSFVLDMYAGTGSFGLECLSRGAKKIEFIENDTEALKNLRKNIESLKINNQTKILPIDIKAFFKKSEFNKKFDIIFVDPPYVVEDLSVIELIKKKNILNKIHIIIIHREKNSNNNFLNNFKILKNKVYGRSEIFFLKLS